MKTLVYALYAAVQMSFKMGWMIFWALALGFLISGIVRAFVSKKRVASLLGRPDFKSLGLASFFGATSSSCSYAAASMARSLFEKGANIVPALAFMIASTNLVLELSIVLWVLMGWQFVVAEFVGGGILIFIMSLLMLTIGPMEEFKKLQLAAQQEAEEDDDEEDAADWRTREGWALAARAFVDEWKMIWVEIVIGLLISGFLMEFVPDSFWQSLFLQDTGSGVFKLLENAFVGPLVSMISFVCSVGNIPMANVLYQGGISFGGAISFIYADLIIIPLILIYRKYYGWKLALWITGIFYVSMALTGVVVDLLFRAVPPPAHQGHAMEMSHTLWLNIVFFVLAVGMTIFARSAPVAEHHCCH